MLHLHALGSLCNGIKSLSIKMASAGIILSFASVICPSLPAEIPLPDAVVYGSLCIDGVPVDQGELVGVVRRNGEDLLEVPADFAFFEGNPFYALRIPLETSIGAPGEVENAAQVGDRLESLRLDGTEIWNESLPLQMAMLSNVSVECSEQIPFLRGDSNSDGNYDISDATYSLLWLFTERLTPNCMKALDTDDSGFVDISDPIYLLAALFRGGPVPAEPFGDSVPADCGFDPTQDDLGCDNFAVCTGEEGNGGQGDGGGAAFNHDFAGQNENRNQDEILAALERDLLQRNRNRRALPRNDDKTSAQKIAAQLREAIGFSPSIIRFGETDRVVEKSLTLFNRSTTEYALSIDSTSTMLEVFPANVRLPAGGSFSFTVRARPGVEVDSAILISSTGIEFSNIGIQFSEKTAPVTAKVSNTRVQTHREGWIALPLNIEPGASTESLELVLSTDEAAPFEEIHFLPAEEFRETISTETQGRRTVVRIRSAEGQIPAGLAGHLFLRPRGPLDPGSHGVLIESALASGIEETKIEVAAIHGEVSVRTPWLDLDGDGHVLTSYDPVLAHRQLAGIEPLYPDNWAIRADDPPPAALSALLRNRMAYLDVDASGNVDSEDIRSITDGLNGELGEDNQLAAMLGNLHVNNAAGSMQPGIARIATDSTAGGRLEIPLLLDLLEPAESLELLVRIEGEGLRIDRFQGSARMLGEFEVRQASPAELRISLAPRKDAREALLAGLQPIGTLSLAVNGQARQDNISITIESLTDGIEGSSVQIPGEREQGEVLDLAACSPDRETWNVSVRLPGRVADASYLSFRLKYPRVVRLIEARLRGPRNSTTELFVHESGPGEASVVVQNPDGEPLVEFNNRTAELLGLRFDRSALTETAPVAVEAQITAAYSGAESLAGEGRAVVLPAEAIADCIQNDDCENAQPHMGRFIRLLGHLFQGAPQPPCHEVNDLDGDGRMEIRDVVLLARKLGLR